MRRRQYDELLRRLGRLDEQVTELRVATLVAGPANPVVAEAYEGLRRQVVAAATERQAHLVQLARFASAVRDQASREELLQLVREWCAQANLQPVSPDERPDLYDVHGEGAEMRIHRYAFVDGETGAPVSLGSAVRSSERPLDTAESDGQPSAPSVPDDLNERGVEQMAAGPENEAPQ